MRLRNKKTGEITSDFDYILLESANYKTYHSVSELNEEWEDYTEPAEPAEPLIEDEKIRKAVRAWAEANNFEYLVCFSTLEGGFKFAGNPIRLEIHFNQSVEIDTDGIYSIAELCGEEEE